MNTKVQSVQPLEDSWPNASSFNYFTHEEMKTTHEARLPAGVPLLLDLAALSDGVGGRLVHAVGVAALADLVGLNLERLRLAFKILVNVASLLWKIALKKTHQFFFLTLWHCEVSRPSISARQGSRGGGKGMKVEAAKFKNSNLNQPLSY